MCSTAAKQEKILSFCKNIQSIIKKIQIPAEKSAKAIYRLSLPSYNCSVTDQP